MVFSCLKFQWIRNNNKPVIIYQVAYRVILFKNVFRENKRSSEPDIGLFGLIFWKIGLPLSDPDVSRSSCLADSLTVALLWWRWLAGSRFVSRKGL